ncbi:MAG: aminotransferase class V-fold PLP-dependent enzyme [Verrucomicrobiota bacterium]
MMINDSLTSIDEIQQNEEARKKAFPITSARNFLAHAGVTALPSCATDALTWFGDRSHKDHQEAGDTMKLVDQVRESMAQLIGADQDEIALLGPTALGLNMVSDGIHWESGDEVVFYRDDYPANVYPWRKLKAQGVRPVAMEADEQGVITWKLLESYLSEKTRLVSLATANFLSGYRVDIDEIGKQLKKRGILFCVDGIQTLGAFPFSVEHVDFLSADSHKWMLGPMGAGLVYVDRDRFEACKPTLLGSWNVVSPNFIAQEEIDYYSGARRYEPGSLNLPGIFSMGASVRMLLDCGIEEISKALLSHREYLIEQMKSIDWAPYYFAKAPSEEENWQSGIVTFRLPSDKRSVLLKALESEKVSVSIRHDRAGDTFLRVSAHFYNTRAELDQIVEICRDLD